MTKRIFVCGLVQGVGFRPFVLRLAQEEKISGFVKNMGAAVEITAQGNETALKNFSQRLVCFLPEGAQIWKISEEIVENAPDYSEFKICQSTAKDDFIPLALPDIATCEKCEKELFSRENRRYLHPFISCTQCGPRYSILKALPYDRENTVMDEFEMCPECEAEYNSAENDRCYAQTIACNSCGPRLYYTQSGNPVLQAVKDLKNGGVIAVKGIGGFHFVCNADDENAVLRLRRLKAREKKPFAVMFRNVQSIDEYAYVNEAQRELLTSPARPVVLLKKKKDFPKPLCSSSAEIGALLPCNPVQLLLAGECEHLVMTSANITGEPIITDNNEILSLYESNEYLDGVLYHNRQIETGLDDSVLRVVGGKAQMIRRSRGYVPLPIELPVSADKDIFTAGGDLKSVFCFVRKNYAYLGRYIGDLENEKCFCEYKSSRQKMENIFGFSPSVYSCDMHPSYFSASLVNADYKIQHHHAHIASVIAEHRLSGEVLGFAFDGTGFGDDEAVWGGEVLLCRDDEYKRVENILPVTLFGGNSASKNAERVKACYLEEIGLNKDETVKAALENKIGTFRSTSAGRLFDCVCALLDIERYNSYEGECACALELCASRAKKPYNLSFDKWNWKPLLIDIINAKEKGVPVCEIALGFHYAIADEILKTAQRHGIKQIALSGGVFANRILTERAISLLEENGFKAYINEKAPCGDGGIALGQAYITALKLQKGV